ncbi:hypothetical protein L210DRAFT_3512793 [Boletus edulis BED1]|uniref:Nudix hydrolase domain-containing protein n=1 Tax=Boletus edulis BED1 TaxID=1328754 RepID=A0AAD4G508_BOLED|nr:hypothetical protein L210DRAFT_3512793 [Boletus edulis BED1]
MPLVVQASAPYPDTEHIMAHVERLSGVKQETRACIHNLLQYCAVRTRARLPRGQSAAVLVPLFVGRVCASQLTLGCAQGVCGRCGVAGGKVDVQDVTVEDTARREAFEEVHWATDGQGARAVVVRDGAASGKGGGGPDTRQFLATQPQRVRSDVDIRATVEFVSVVDPSLVDHRTADPKNHTDVPWSEGGAVRLHRFLTGRESGASNPCLDSQRQSLALARRVDDGASL